jgi:homoserine dehydrogenase
MFSADLILVGFGHVGRRFVRLLGERASELHDVHGIDWRVVGIVTSRHGRARDLRGLDASRALALAERGDSLDVLDAPGTMPAPGCGGGAADVRADDGGLGPGQGGGRPDRSPSGAGVRVIEEIGDAARRGGGTRSLVVVETTLLDIAAGQPAIDHVRAGLGAGAHVITANKGPVAFAYAELDARARAADRAFLFEGAVMDGIPVFNLVRDTLPAVRVAGFSGVVNSTTNFVITAMENGREFGESLAEMQAAGIAEADASLDVDGWVLMDARTTPHRVERSGIGHLTGTAVRDARARGRHMKLVARGSRRRGEVVVRVGVEEIPAGHLFATLGGQQNALLLETDLLGEFAVVQLGGGLTQTAYALVADLVALGRR